jgi:hypothetical protein
MNPLYEKVQELKNRIAAGEISAYTALDLFFQHVDKPAFPPEAQPEWVRAAKAPDPVPEPASAEPADGQTAEADVE